MDFTTRFYFLFYESCRIFLRLVHYELEKFADGLATWIQGLTAQTMPENWRDSLADELADWEDKGIIVQPHGLPVLEKWILAKAKRRGTLPIGYPESDPGTRPDRFADLARQYRSAVAVADTETAGYDRDSGIVYQETSPEFRAKVQQALELLNPEVAAWWQSPGVNGLVRSYDQDDYPGSSPHHSFCLVENGHAIVVVDRRFTAGRTAQGIIYLAHSGLFLFPKDANFNFRPSFSPISAAVREMRVGRDPAVLDSARSVSIVAEMAVQQPAPLEDGALTARAKDKGDLTWRDLLRALAAYRLPSDVRALEILVPGRGSGPVREILLSAHLLRAFLQLPLADRQTIMAAASSRRPDEAQAAIMRAVAAKTPAQLPQQPSPARQNPPGQKLAPSPKLPYNQNRSPKADKLLAFEGYPPGGNGLVALLIYLKINNDLGKKLFTHYVQESGSSYTLSVAEASSLGAESVSVDYIKGFTAKKDALVAQAKATGKSASGPISGNVDDTADLPYTLGNFTVRFKGTLTATPDERWSFNGTMQFVDEYDFDPKLLDPNSNRSATGELKVILAWAFVNGKPFKIDSSFPATQTSADSSVKWAGTWGKASGGGEE